MHYAPRIPTVAGDFLPASNLRLEPLLAPHELLAMPTRYAAIAVSIAVLLVSGCSAPRLAKNSGTTNRINDTSNADVPSEKAVGSPWRTLLNGKDLAGWTETKFGGAGEPVVENQKLVIAMGAGLSGVNWTNPAAIPKIDYELELEAMKLEGNDFFCGLTFPVAETSCTLVVGGWGGSVVGLSSIDGLDASENETTKNLYFEPKRWFRIGLTVTGNRITVKIDGDKVMELDTTGKKIDLRHGEIYLSKPLGLATYQTSAAFKNIRIRELRVK